MHDALRCSELRVATGPAAVLDAEHIERQRLCADRHDAILADDAVLLAAADQFAGQKQQRPLAAMMSTSWFTDALASYCGGRTTPRSRTIPAAPRSLTMTSPLARPSSSVRKLPVSCEEPLTTGKMAMFS